MANYDNNLIKYFPHLDDVNAKLQQMTFCIIRDVFKDSRYIDVSNAHQYEPARRLIQYSLISHIQDVTKFALNMAKSLIEVKLDELIVGCTLHDIDKFMRYGEDLDGNIIEDISVVHAIAGGNLLKRMDFSKELIHMVMSHSRSCSEESPSTKEAIILRHADEAIVELEYRKIGLDIWRLGDGNSGLHCLSR